MHFLGAVFVEPHQIGAIFVPVEARALGMAGLVFVVVDGPNNRICIGAPLVARGAECVVWGFAGDEQCGLSANTAIACVL